MNPLHKAAQQALEAMLNFPDDISDEMFESITALKAALAQQDEPDAYGYASRLAVAIWEKHYKNTAPQWKPLDDLMDVLTQIDNMTSGLTRLAQQAEPVLVEGELPPRYVARSPVQAEPMEPVAWRFEARHIDTAFGPAVSLKHPGPEHKYMRNVEPLYTAPPRRTMVPLTEEELLKAIGWERAEMYMKLTPSFPVDEAKQETLTNARAIEKAVWEKNNGQA